VFKAFDGEGFVGKLHVHDTPLREAKGSGRHYTHLQDAGIDCNLPFPVVTEGVGGVGPSDVVLVLDSSLCQRVPTELKKAMAKRYWRGAFSDASPGITEAFADGEVRVFFPAPGSGHPVLVYGFGETVLDVAPTMKMHADRVTIERCRKQVFETTRRMKAALQWVLRVDRFRIPPDGYRAFSASHPDPVIERPPTAASTTTADPPAPLTAAEPHVALDEVASLLGQLQDGSGGLHDLIIGGRAATSNGSGGTNVSEPIEVDASVEAANGSSRYAQSDRSLHEPFSE
jgi:hypothetical protein